MNKTAGLLALAIVCAAVPAAAQATARGPEDCAKLRNLELPGVPISDVTAEWIAAGPAPLVGGPPVTLPAYCRVQAMLNRRQGPDGQQYGVGFAIALPVPWNGRFLFQGGGGFNGTLFPPLGVGAAGGMPALARGFAVASTDAGHRSPKGAVALNRIERAMTATRSS